MSTSRKSFYRTNFSFHYFFSFIEVFNVPSTDLVLFGFLDTFIHIKPVFLFSFKGLRLGTPRYTAISSNVHHESLVM